MFEGISKLIKKKDEGAGKFTPVTEVTYEGLGAEYGGHDKLDEAAREARERVVSIPPEEYAKIQGEPLEEYEQEKVITEAFRGAGSSPIRNHLMVELDKKRKQGGFEVVVGKFVFPNRGEQNDAYQAEGIGLRRKDS